MWAVSELCVLPCSARDRFRRARESVGGDGFGVDPPVSPVEIGAGERIMVRRFFICETCVESGSRWPKIISSSI